MIDKEKIEWIEINLPYNTGYLKYCDSYLKYCDNQLETDKKSFCGRELNKPGTLVELEDGTIHLIGTINKHRGTCDDCVAFDENVIIKRYATVIELDI
jgi:hypothetical protein